MIQFIIHVLLNTFVALNPMSMSISLRANISIAQCTNDHLHRTDGNRLPMCTTPFSLYLIHNINICSPFIRGVMTPGTNDIANPSMDANCFTSYQSSRHLPQLSQIYLLHCYSFKQAIACHTFQNLPPTSHHFHFNNQKLSFMYSRQPKSIDEKPVLAISLINISSLLDISTKEAFLLAHQIFFSK